MKNRLPRKLKKRYKNEHCYHIKMAEMVMFKERKEWFYVGFRKLPYTNAEHTPYKLIGVEDSGAAMEKINQFRNGSK